MRPLCWNDDGRPRELLETDLDLDVAGALQRAAADEAVCLHSVAKRYANTTSVSVVSTVLRSGRVYFYDSRGGQAVVRFGSGGLEIESGSLDWVETETPASGEIGVAITDDVLTIYVGSASRRSIGWHGFIVKFSEIEVAPGDPNWVFMASDSSGAIGDFAAEGEFSTGPAADPRGSFRLHVPGGSGDQSGQLRTSVFHGMRIADIEILQYTTYVEQWNGQQIPYLTIYVNRDGDPDGAPDDRLIFEAYFSTPESGLGSQHNVAANVWQEWDVANGNSYTDSSAGYFTFAAYAALFPDAVIVPQDESRPGFRLANGFASPEDAFTTYIDSVTVNGVTYEIEA